MELSDLVRKPVTWFLTGIAGAMYLANISAAESPKQADNPKTADVRSATTQSGNPVENNSQAEWQTVVSENLTDGQFDKPNQYPIKTKTDQFTESGGVLYLNGPTNLISRFLTAEFDGVVRVVADYNLVDMLDGSFIGIQLGKNDDTARSRLFFENYSGMKRFRFIDKSTNPISTKTLSATQRFSLMLERDKDNKVTAYVSEDFDPSKRIEERVYQSLDGSSALVGKSSGGIVDIRAGDVQAIYQVTRFQVDKLSETTAVKPATWTMY